MTTRSARPSTRPSRRRRSTGNRDRPAPPRAPRSSATSRAGTTRGAGTPRSPTCPRPSSNASTSSSHNERSRPRLRTKPVATTSPSASDGLTTRRISTVGIDFAANGPISPDDTHATPTGPAQAATDGGQGTNGNGWPLHMTSLTITSQVGSGISAVTGTPSSTSFVWTATTSDISFMSIQSVPSLFSVMGIAAKDVTARPRNPLLLIGQRGRETAASASRVAALRAGADRLACAAVGVAAADCCRRSIACVTGFI
jgi:hypothetical protein